MSEIISVPPSEEPRFKPVELETGHEAVELSLGALRAFRDYLPTIPLGEHTLATMTAMTDNLLTKPDAIQVFQEGPARNKGRFIHENLFYGFDVSVDATLTPESFLIEVVPPQIEEQLVPEILDLSRQLHLQIDEKMARRLAYAHLIGHEMSHGIENAYSANVPVREENLMPDKQPTPIYSHLFDAAFEAGLSEPVEVPAAPVSSARRIESERFAEGIGQLFTLHEMKRLGVIPDTTDLDQKVLDILVNQRQQQTYQDAVRIAAETPAKESSPNGSPGIALQRRLHEAGTTINHIGYGRPHRSETLNRILALTP